MQNGLRFFLSTMIFSASIMFADESALETIDSADEEGRYCYHLSEQYSCISAGCFWDDAGRYCYYG